MQYINNALGAPKPVGPYSQAVKVGNVLYLAGQIGLDPVTGSLVSGGVREQAEQVLSNIDAVLRTAGSSPAHIALTTIFLADIADGPVVNELYGKFIDADRAPARQTVAVKALPLGALIEISVIASVAQ